MIRNRKPSRRPGAVAPLTAIIAIVLLGMTAFALDIGWITLTQGQLQSAADAAALAGAQPLMDGYVNFTISTSSTQKKVVLQTYIPTAVTNATNYASYNWAGDVNSVTLLSTDI